MTHNYHDDEIQGKAYDSRLVRRLLTFVRPYTGLIVIAVLMLVAVAAFEIALPYLMRSAIDDYIVATSRLVVDGDEPSGFVEEHRAELLPVDAAPPGSADLLGNAYLARTKTLSRHDPRDVARASELGIIRNGFFYLADRDRAGRAGLSVGDYLGTGALVAVPSEELVALTPEQVRILREDDLRGVARIAGIIVVMLVLSFAFTLLQMNMMELTSQRVMYDIRMRVLAHLQKLSLSFFDKNPVGRLVTRATNDVQILHEMFTSIVITLLRDLFVLVGVVIMLLRLNWRLAVVSFIVLPFMAWVTARFSVMIRDAFREVRVKVARINASLQENISGMRVTQIFRREQESCRRFAGINHENFLAAMKQVRTFAMFMPLMELASAVAMALVIWYGGGKVIQSTLSLGTLVAFLSYVQMFFRPLRNLAQQYGTMQQAMASSERIFQLLDNDQIIPEPESATTLGAVSGRIAFENVCFAYVEGDPVLRDVSFTVEPGETVAIVGATGAGKTSIISLIERFYDIDEGRITLDGVDIRELRKSDLRSHIGLVMQDVFIFAGDIKGNIRLGNQAVDDEALRSVARHVNADRFIEKLPAAYDEEVRERGATLS
ncbi:ABC transporter ATP-binding protein/permease, partial [bacterium]|nr:ABC transporter ATP-binding protein/permease [bacterium]